MDVCIYEHGKKEEWADLTIISTTSKSWAGTDTDKAASAKKQKKYSAAAELAKATLTTVKLDALGGISMDANRFFKRITKHGPYDLQTLKDRISASIASINGHMISKMWLQCYGFSLAEPQDQLPTPPGGEISLEEDACSLARGGDSAKAGVTQVPLSPTSEPTPQDSSVPARK